MNIVLWVIQVLLGLTFIWSGGMKAFAPVEMLAEGMEWVATTPVWLVRLPGFAEVLGAIGVVLPSLTRIRPGLAPLAAAGLALVMVLAFVFHVVRGEYGMVMPNIIMFAMAAFVAWGRSKKVVIEPR